MLWLMLLGSRTVLAQTPEPQVTIASPAADAYVSGVVTLRANVDPESAVSGVKFFVDGREVCRAASAPFQCPWDFGRTVDEHQVRVVVDLTTGSSVARTVRTGAIRATFRARTDAVQVTVTVNDSKGGYARGLPDKTFHVFEDGKAQHVQSFAAEDVPLELVLALDISDSMRPAMAVLKTVVKDFLASVPPQHHVTILAFNDRIYTVARSSADAAARGKAIDALEPWGMTALYDAIGEGLRVVEPRSGRKAILVFTDGEDQGSHTSLGEISRDLETGDATLYMVGLGRGASAEALKKLMEKMSEPTGGRMLFADNLGKLHTAFEELLLELTNQYLLGYESTNTARDGTWREIKVTVDGFNRVRARKGYRAPDR